MRGNFSIKIIHLALRFVNRVFSACFFLKKFKTHTIYTRQLLYGNTILFI